MFNETDLPNSVADGPKTGFDASFDAEAPPAASAPPRFGRLALCVAAASALAFGVVGTVAYGIWFNHDQQAYAEAMAGARQALGMAGAPASAAAISAIAAVPAQAPAPVTAVAASAVRPAITPVSPHAAQFAGPQSPPLAMLTSEGEEGGKQAVWAGEVKRRPLAAAPDADPATNLADASPAAPTSATLPARSPRPQQVAANRQGKDWHNAQQERRANAADTRHKASLFARVGQFFRHVNYRQHGSGGGSGSQQQDVYSHP